MKGAPDAPVELLWFSDVRSPLTVKASQIVADLLRKYPSQLRVTLRHRPVDVRADGRLAHEAAVAAGAQGKFWEMHDLIVASGKTVTKDSLAAMASELGLDVSRFTAELDAGRYRPVVDRDLADAQRRDVRGTPVFIIEGQRIDGVQPMAMFEQAIKTAIERKGGQ